MYDTIVIGNDLSSLIAAVTSCLSGKRTALLREGNIPFFYSESGYTFNTDPLPWTGFGPHEFFRRFLATVNESLIEEYLVHPLDPSLQVLLPCHRIDMAKTKECHLKEFKREFEGDIEAVESLYETLDLKKDILSKILNNRLYRRSSSINDVSRFLGHVPALVWHRLSLSRRFKPLRNKNISLQKTIDAITLLFSNMSVDTANSFVRAYALTSLFNEQFYFAGGKRTLTDRLVKIFLESGGSLLEEGCSILRLQIQDTVNADITINDENQAIKGRCVIVSEKWEKLKTLLFVDQRFSKFVKKYETIGKPLHPFTIHIGVNDKGLPEKMGEYVIIISEEDKSLTNGNLLFVEMSSRNDIDRAPSGKRAVSVSVFLDDSPLRLNNAVLEKVSRKIQENIEKKFPFISENIDYLNIEKSIEISRKYQEMICPKYSPTHSNILGISPFSCMTPVHNVFLTGGIVLAGLGFIGEILSGFDAAQCAIGE